MSSPSAITLFLSRRFSRVTSASASLSWRASARSVDEDTMRQRDKQAPQSAEETVRDIRRATRRQFSAEEKIRIVLEGLRGEDSIAELCRKEGIAQNLYYRWSKEFLEAGKKRLEVLIT